MKKTEHILIIDDDNFITDSLSDFLREKQYNVQAASNGQEGLDRFEEMHPTMVLLDQELPDISGLEVCRRILAIDPATKIIFITAHATVRYAVEAMQAGAFNYLSKPFALEELLIAINMASKSLQLEGKLRAQEYQARRVQKQAQLVGGSAMMDGLREQIQLASRSDTTVLITGETGVGKTEVAKAIHSLQDRRETFLSINCATIPENLMEAEYFGHEKGAFTGADVRREGIFELADSGSLVLDEIGEIPLHLQSKLLTVLEEKQVRRIGGRRAVPVDVRIIATTNHDLDQAIAQKKFRQDLYYRLAIFKMHIQPLRDHPEDIPELATYFANRFCRRRVHIAQSQLQQLKAYPWPGNIRELRNIIERAALFIENDRIHPADLLARDSIAVNASPPTASPVDAHRMDIVPLAQMKAAYIRRALELCRGNKSQTARMLGVSLSTLKRQLKKAPH
jgi:DNA-binding NtrC family response regulator